MADSTSPRSDRVTRVAVSKSARRLPERFGITAPATTFLGRERQIAEIGDLLNRRGARLLTLIGPGGAGKTRLALAVANTAAESFPDGVVVVGLAGLADPEFFLATAGQALGLRDGGEDPIARLGTLLGERKLLLVLDNIEHLVEATPPLVDLLAACPGLTILGTSRVVLRLSGEHVYPVPPLLLPEPDQPLNPADALQPEAVAPFVQRARTADPTFELTPDNAPAVAEIVRRLDGLPLAIELAAARTPHLPPDALLARLERRLAMLVGGPRDQPARLQTMRQAIDWSHQLLTPVEQLVFRRLAVFAGGFTLDAAEAIVPAAGQLDIEVLEVLTALVDNSLVRIEPGPRYMMLEMVLEFARERLATSGDEANTRERHGHYFCELMEAIAPYLQWQADTAGSIARIEADLDNVRAALAWSSKRDPSNTFARLAVAMESFWAVRGRLAEGCAWSDRALEASDACPLPLRASVVRAAAWIARYQCELDRAEALGRRGLALSREHGDPLGIAHAIVLLGYVEDHRGNFVSARAYHERARAIAEELGEAVWIAWAMRNVGAQIRMSGEPETAEIWFDEALARFQQGGFTYGVGVVKSDLAAIAASRGATARAASLWLDRLVPTWDAQGLRDGLEALGGIAATCGQMATAAFLLGAAEAQRTRLGVVLMPRQTAPHDALVETVRSALDAASFDSAWRDGQRLSSEEARSVAIDAAHILARSGERKPGATARDYGLTRRELEVLRFVVRGSTNREIAAALFISAPTVKRHLTNLYGKLGVESRAEAAAYASSHELA